LAIAEEPLAWGLELAEKRDRRFRRKGSERITKSSNSPGQETRKRSQEKLNPSGGLRKANKTFAKGI
jgi:hypothetical protein